MAGGFQIRLIGKPWFEAKPHGYGAGWPIAWQGWVVLAGFLAATIGSVLWLGAGWVFGIVQTLLVAGFVAVAAVKTEGGWRWRSGGRG